MLVQSVLRDPKLQKLVRKGILAPPQDFLKQHKNMIGGYPENADFFRFKTHPRNGIDTTHQEHLQNLWRKSATESHFEIAQKFLITGR